MNRLPGVLQCVVRARPISVGALGVLVWGVVVAPLVHSAGHRLDHDHDHAHDHGYEDEAAGQGDESEYGEEHAHGQHHPHAHEYPYGHGHAHQPEEEHGWEADADGAVDEQARHGDEREAHAREAAGRSGHRSRHKPHGHGHNSLEHFGVALTSVPIFLPPKVQRVDLPIPAIEYESPSLRPQLWDSMRVRGPPIVHG
jgi:hypothetical protein